MRQQPVSAAPAYQCCEWDRTGAGQHGVGCRLGADGELVGARYVACRQWSIGARDRATLVRHFVDVVAQRTPPLAPARGARGMLESTAPTALVEPCGLPPSFTPTHARARPAAILLTAVAVRTQQNLIATTRAQEQASRTVHVHPRAKPKVLDGLIPGCNTAAAPPSSARCRARRGTKLPGISNRCRAHLLRHRRRCTPPALAPTGTHESTTTTAATTRRLIAPAVDKPPAHRTSLWTAPAGSVACPPLPERCLRPDALRLPTADRSIDQQQQTKLKTAASPSLGSGS